MKGIEKVMTMEKFLSFMGQMIFGKTYKDGYIDKNVTSNYKKDRYVLRSVFPNEQIMAKVNDIIQEEEKAG